MSSIAHSCSVYRIVLADDEFHHAPFGEIGRLDCARLRSPSESHILHGKVNQIFAARLYESIDRADGADKFGEIFAVAGGLVERFQTRVRERFGQTDAARKRAVGKD